jgi:predicted AAA+ superfamily ATPase
VKKIIYRDIPAIFDIRMKNILYELFLYACENTSGIFNLRSIADTFEINYETAQNYMFYLRSSFLLKISQNYSGSPAKRMRKNKKVHVVHPSLAVSALRYSKRELREKLMGALVESLFAGEYFWRDKNKNEVDIVVPSKPPVPIEVKYQRAITSADLRPILKFMERFGSPYGIVITKNIMKSENIKGKTIYFVPAWLWALSVDMNSFSGL